MGVVYVREVMPLLHLLQRQRMLSMQEAVKGVAPAELADLRRSIEARMGKLAAVETAHGDDLGTAPGFAKLVETGKALPAAAKNVDAVFAAHTAHVQALLDVLGAATDGSNLTLDPDLDSYYLMDAAMFRLPSMIESQAQVSGLGGAMLAVGTATPAQLRRVTEQSILATVNQSALEAGLGKSVASNPGVQAALHYDAPKAAMTAFNERVEATLLRPDGMRGDVAAHTEAGNQTVDAMFALTERVTGQLDRLLAERVARLATANSQVAERGGQIISTMVATMQGIHNSSSKISDIIATIDSIAFQTNILALNAAVEAAWAGESGRGFAVVAAEVRALSQRTATAAREVKALINTSVEQVAAGSAVVQHAGTTIGEIVATSQQVNKLLLEIAIGADEQARGVTETTHAVHELDDVTQQNAALVEQTAAAASSLQQQARALAVEVAQFKLPQAA